MSAVGGKQTLANDRGRPVALAFLGHPKVATGSSVVATESKRSTDPLLPAIGPIVTSAPVLPAGF